MANVNVVGIVTYFLAIGIGFGTYRAIYQTAEERTNSGLVSSDFTGEHQIADNLCLLLETGFALFEQIGNDTDYLLNLEVGEIASTNDTEALVSSTGEAALQLSNPTLACHFDGTADRALTNMDFSITWDIRFDPKLILLYNSLQLGPFDFNYTFEFTGDLCFNDINAPTGFQNVIANNTVAVHLGDGADQIVELIGLIQGFEASHYYDVITTTLTDFGYKQTQQQWGGDCTNSPTASPLTDAQKLEALYNERSN